METTCGRSRRFYAAPLGSASDEFFGFFLPAPTLEPGDSLGWTCAYAASTASSASQSCSLQVLHSPPGALDSCVAPPDLH